MEALLIRIDHFHDRALYVSTVKSWLEELRVTHGRLITMGETHLLFIEATAKQNTELLACFESRVVDTNARDEPCIDKFIDIVARKPVATTTCKGFLEMNILNATMLERMLVNEWNGDKLWVEEVLSTPRTKALLKWREDAKAARKDRRKRAAHDRISEKAAKKAKAEEEAAQKAEVAQNEGEDGEDPAEVEDTTTQEPLESVKATAKPDRTSETKPPSKTSTATTPTESSAPSAPTSKRKNKQRKRK